MHPGLAAVVLAASPSPSPSASRSPSRSASPSPSPSLSPSSSPTPSAHGINWGDFPTWVAAIATVVALGAAFAAAVIAYRQFRQQTDVLKGEVERNKRRDELLDGQLDELRDREEDRLREQAEGVKVSWNDAGFGWVFNGSRRPITKVVAGIADSLPDGGTNTHHAGQWRIYREIGPAFPLASGELTAVTPFPLASAEVAVIRPDKGAECLFEANQLQGENRRLVVRFRDDAGRRWQLDEYMHLERAPDDGW